MRRLLAVAVVAAAAFTLVPTTTAAAASGPSDIVRLLESLPVKVENNRGYSRDRFDDWTTRNGCDTREWVLIDEAQYCTRRGCDVRGGRWWSRRSGSRHAPRCRHLA